MRPVRNGILAALALAVLVLPTFVFNRQLGAAAFGEARRLQAEHGQTQTADILFGLAAVLYRPDLVSRAESKLAEQADESSANHRECSDWLPDAEALVKRGSDSAIIRDAMARCYLKLGRPTDAIIAHRDGERMRQVGNARYPLGVLDASARADFAKQSGSSMNEARARLDLGSGLLAYHDAKRAHEPRATADSLLYAAALYEDARRESPAFVASMLAQTRVSWATLRKGQTPPLVEIAQVAARR